mmetsp:Transcript_86613/g.249911  ORF Transcript_86613/g.249911 Transcript_86613/m.249911 type:complete len:223 (+) Transcript_86613:1064-1732(+)
MDHERFMEESHLLVGHAAGAGRQLRVLLHEQPDGGLGVPRLQAQLVGHLGILRDVSEREVHENDIEAVMTQIRPSKELLHLRPNLPRHLRLHRLMGDELLILIAHEEDDAVQGADRALPVVGQIQLVVCSTRLLHLRECHLQKLEAPVGINLRRFVEEHRQVRPALGCVTLDGGLDCGYLEDHGPPAPRRGLKALLQGLLIDGVGVEALADPGHELLGIAVE